MNNLSSLLWACPMTCTSSNANWWAVTKQCTLVRYACRAGLPPICIVSVLFFWGSTSSCNIFGIDSFAREMIDHAQLCIRGDGVSGFHQCISKGGVGVCAASTL